MEVVPDPNRYDTLKSSGRRPGSVSRMAAADPHSAGFQGGVGRRRFSPCGQRRKACFGGTDCVEALNSEFNATSRPTAKRILDLGGGGGVTLSGSPSAAGPARGKGGTFYCSCRKSRMSDRSSYLHRISRIARTCSSATSTLGSTRWIKRERVTVFTTLISSLSCGIWCFSKRTRSGQNNRPTVTRRQRHRTLGAFHPGKGLRWQAQPLLFVILRVTYLVHWQLLAGTKRNLWHAPEQRAVRCRHCGSDYQSFGERHLCLHARHGR
jgi:hypothetical protein